MVVDALLSNVVVISGGGGIGGIGGGITTGSGGRCVVDAMRCISGDR